MQKPIKFLILVFLSAGPFSIGLGAQAPVAQASSAGIEVEMDLTPIEPTEATGAEEGSETPEGAGPNEEVPEVESPEVDTGMVSDTVAPVEEGPTPAPDATLDEITPEVELSAETAEAQVDDTAEELDSAAGTVTTPVVPETPAAPEMPDGVDELIATPEPAEVVEESVADVQEAIEDEPATTVAPETQVPGAGTEPVAELTAGMAPESVTDEGSGESGADGDLGESIRYISTEQGDRLVVRYEVGREDNPARSLQLRLFDDRVYDPGSYSFVPSEVFVITGQGLTVSGLRFEVDELDRREAMIDLLERFEQDARVFSNRRNEVVGREEDWMSGGVSDLNGQLPYGTIETDFFKKPATVTFNWDFRSNRVWLSLNGLVAIDSEIAFPLRNYLENVDRYVSLRKEYASEIALTREKIAGILAE